MSKAATAMPEAALKKLRRLDGNMRCPNCDTRAAQGIGFGNVCVKYRTFVCDMCKTSHQAISHRVKSVTMSTWTMEEVHELLDENGGGNDAARHIWLANAPPCGTRYNGGHRPKEGDKIEYFKQFVVDCYELGKFRTSSPYLNSRPPITEVDASVSAGGRSRNAPSLTHSSKISSSKPDNSVAVDLLDVEDSLSITPIEGMSQFPSCDALSSIGTADIVVSSIPQAPSFDPFAIPSTASTTFSASDPFSTAASSGTSSVSNYSTAQVSRVSSFEDVMSTNTSTMPTSSTAVNLFDLPLPKADTPVHDPFGNDVLIPSPQLSESPFGVQSSIPPTAIGTSIGSSYVQQSNGVRAQMPLPMSAMPMNNGLNAGLAISSMNSFIPTPPMQQPVYGKRPPMAHSLPAYNASTMYSSQYNRPIYNASYNGYQTTPSNQIQAFDFVDDELKASVKR